MMEDKLIKINKFEFLQNNFKNIRSKSYDEFLKRQFIVLFKVQKLVTKGERFLFQKARKFFHAIQCTLLRSV